MKNAFLRSQERYGGSALEGSPYARASQIWDERVGSSIAHARNWRLMAFLSLGVCAISLGAYIYERQNTHIATYVVPINEYGRPGRIELAGQTYSLSPAEIGYFLADWVRLVRSKPTDAVVLRQNWTNAYHFLAPSAATVLDGYARSSDPFARVGQEAVSVDVSSVLPRSPHTFQINWRESVYETGGRAHQSNWTALITVTQRQPKTEVDLRNNPLGLLITSFQWSREL